MPPAQNTGAVVRGSIANENLKQGHKVKILAKSSLKSDTDIIYDAYPVRTLCFFSAPLKNHFEHPTRLTNSVTLVSSSKAAVKLLLLWVLYLASGMQVDHYVEVVSFEMALEALLVACTLKIRVLEDLLENRVRKDIVAQLPACDIKILFERFHASYPFRVLAAETIAAGIIVQEVRDWDVLREYYEKNKEFARALDKALQEHGGAKEEKRAR